MDGGDGAWVVVRVWVGSETWLVGYVDWLVGGECMPDW
jgi:hypothetical protein